MHENHFPEASRKTIAFNSQGIFFKYLFTKWQEKDSKLRKKQHSSKLMEMSETDGNWTPEFFNVYCKLYTIIVKTNYLNVKS